MQMGQLITEGVPKMKRLFSALLVLCLLAACGAARADETPSTGHPWVNPNLCESFPERPGPEENFYLWANYDLFTEATAGGEIKPYDLMAAAEASLSEQFLDIYQNPEYTDTESEILQILYRLASDTEKRKQESLDLLMSRVNRIKAVKSVEELTELIQEKGFLLATPFLVFNAQKSAIDPNQIVTCVERKLMLDYLPMEDEPTEEELMNGPAIDTEAPRKGLRLMQYSEEEADRIIGGLKQYDEPTAEDQPEWMDGTRASLQQIRENCPPIYALLSSAGAVKEGAETQSIYEFSTGCIPVFSGFYTDENLETLKAIVALSMYDYAKTYLNLDAFTAETYHAEDEKAQQDLIREVRYLASIPAAQAYITHYCPEEKWAVASSLFEDIREAMRKRIQASAWLSEESRKKAMEKLDNLALGQIIPPGGSFDCGTLLEELRGCNNLMDAAAYCEYFNRQCSMRFVGEPMERTNPYTNDTYGALALGGQYIPSLNIFNIGASALNGTFCDFSSTEALYGSLGFHIAHEVSHGYDTLGAQRDVTGEAPLFTESDSQYFRDQSKKTTVQLDKIETGNGVMLQGEQVTYETMADLTGMTLVLDLAKQKEYFDYAACFRAAARFFYEYRPGNDNHPKADGRVDPHPPYYVRINFTAAQFDEFYQAYPSVKEGTPMYIAPEDRNLIW